MVAAETGVVEMVAAATVGVKEAAATAAAKEVVKVVEEKAVARVVVRVAEKAVEEKAEASGGAIAVVSLAEEEGIEEV